MGETIAMSQDYAFIKWKSKLSDTKYDDELLLYKIYCIVLYASCIVHRISIKVKMLETYIVFGGCSEPAYSGIHVIK